IDPAVYDYPLLNAHWPIVAILVAYLAFVVKLGRIFMEHRKPYDLKNVLLVYNIFQVLYNTIIFGYVSGCSLSPTKLKRFFPLQALYYIVINSVYDRRCIVSLPFDHPLKYVERNLSYAYYINKVIDLLDTIFFVLRKNYNQITVLHVYHHIMMPYIMYWIVNLHGFGGQYAMMALLNTFVHAVMYFYYFISAKYSGLKSSLWWKKYITKLQLVQFVLLFFQALDVLIFNPSCKVPIVMQYLQLYTATIMTLMFSNFYYHSYMKPQPKKEAKS
ncbi:hypothetical protein KR093_010850, partial [Drosophila rubida]